MKHLNARTAWRVAVLLILAPCAGCESAYTVNPEIVKTVPVSGTLTYKGRALESHQVSLVPEDGARGASGVTDSEGKFTLGTNEPGDGAPPGRYKVSVAFVPPETDTVNSGPVEDPALLPKPAIEIPATYANPETSGLVQEVPADGIPDLRLELQ